MPNLAICDVSLIKKFSTVAIFYGTVALLSNIFLDDFKKLSYNITRITELIWFFIILHRSQHVLTNIQMP